LKVGDKVFYISDHSFKGTVLEVNQTLCRVVWFNSETIEWVPLYSVEVFEEYE